MEKPILFSAEMVEAILVGKKTQTRRVVTNGKVGRLMNGNQKLWPYLANGKPVKSPYGKPGDTLWVREAWKTELRFDDCKPSDLTIFSNVYYPANDEVSIANLGYAFGKTRPSIFMPRWVSRITLQVDSVRVERLQSITNMDAEQEGVNANTIFLLGSARNKFMDLWDKINAGRGYGWKENPWVWVVTFTLLSNNGMHLTPTASPLNGVSVA